MLLDVFGVGTLILGDSGIGKSECALDLIDRGHRLVADDVVEIKRMGERLVGASPDLTRYHMELRGLGVLNIRDLYGVSSISLSKQLGLVIHLERWEEGKEYDRLGLRDESFQILGIEMPLVRMPVAPARNIALLVEVAARNQLLREGGLRRGPALRGAGGRPGGPSASELGSGRPRPGKRGGGPGGGGEEGTDGRPRRRRRLAAVRREEDRERGQEAQARRTGSKKTGSRA